MDQQLSHVLRLDRCERLDVLDTIPNRILHGQLIFSIEITEFLHQHRVVAIERLLRQTTVNDDRHDDAMIFDGQMQKLFECIDVILGNVKVRGVIKSGINVFAS